MTPALLCLTGYLIGSVNIAILVLRLRAKEDPRSRFSKNAGTTNVYRIMGLKWAALVLVSDVGKAALASLMAANYLQPAGVPWVGFFLVFGNRFPCFHGFKGGKGVAHFIGFSLFMIPTITALALAGWCVVYRMVGLPFAASLVLVGILGIGLTGVADTGIVGIIGILCCVGLIGFNHWPNILEWKSGKPGPDRHSKKEGTGKP